MEVKIINPGDEPVTLRELHAFCHMNPDEDDAVLLQMNKSARIMCQRYTNQSFTEQVIQVYTPEDNIELPYWPVKEITSVKRGDTDVTDYKTTGNEIITVSASGPLTIRYTAGHDPLLEDLRLAVMMTVKYWYDMGYIDGKLPAEAKNIMNLATDNLFI